jgi:hypothetical protein
MQMMFLDDSSAVDEEQNTILGRVRPVNLNVSVE